MNFNTASNHAKSDSHPIARSTWSASGAPTQWLTFESGAFYLYTATTRDIVKAGDLDEADFRATDWHFPEGCDVTVIPKPDIGGESQANEPTFDVSAPPCVVG